MDHLYISSEWLVRCQRAAKDTPLGKGREHILELADKLLEEELGKSPGDIDKRQSASEAQILGLAYQLTKDETYALGADALISELISLEYWVQPAMLRRVPAWYSDLDTSEVACGVGIAYDWIRPILDDERRQTTEAALWSLGIEPMIRDWVDGALRVHCLDSMGHNWWAVCIGASAVALLACRGLQDRDYWLGQITVALDEFVTYKGNELWNKPGNFGEQGGFYESFTYCNYTLIYLLKFYEALACCSGQLPKVYELPELAKTGKFYLDTIYETTQGICTPDFGDHHLHQTAEPMVLARLASLYRDEQLQWYFHRVRSHPQNPFELLWYDDTLDSKPPVYEDLAMYPDIGWALLRSVDRDMFVALRAGDVWNHAHSDCGALIVFDRGVQFVADSGTCRYSAPEYHSYYCQTYAHSTLLVNDQGGPKDDLLYGLRFRGQLLHPCTNKHYQKVTAELTGPLSRLVRRATRTLFLFDDILVVVDDVFAFEPSTYQLLWHTPATFSLADDVVTLKNGTEKLYLSVFSPKPLNWSTEAGYGSDLQERPFLKVSTQDTNRNGHFITMISREHPDMLQSKLMELPNGLGLSFTGVDRTWQVILNTTAGRRMHENSNVAWQIGEDTVETDGHLLVLGQDLFGVHQGSYARRNRRVIFNNYAKTDCVLDLGGLSGIDALKWHVQP